MQENLENETEKKEEQEEYTYFPEAAAYHTLMNLDPLEVIQAAAQGIGLVLNDPKPNCKHCHGRGWTGRNAETKEPIPCSCIFPKYDSQRPQEPIMLPLNRKQRRALKHKKEQLD